MRSSDSSLRTALGLAQTSDCGCSRPSGGAILGLLVRFSAQQTDLSSRLRGVWGGIAVTRMTVVLEVGVNRPGFTGE